MKRLELKLQRLQILAGLEAHGLSGRNIHFRSRSGIPADPRLAGFDGKDAKAAKFNPIVGFQSVFHAVKNGIDGLFGFCLTDARSLDNLIDKIQFDHWQPPSSLPLSHLATVFLTLKKGFKQWQSNPITGFGEWRRSTP
jgi:hypothetical protein